MKRKIAKKIRGNTFIVRVGTLVRYEQRYELRYELHIKSVL